MSSVLLSSIVPVLLVDLMDESRFGHVLGPGRQDGRMIIFDCTVHTVHSVQCA
jgi:hypothetical protein